MSEPFHDPTVTGREVDRLLVETKLSPPSLRPGAVSRAKLIETTRSSGCPVVGVTAPAGYGKSTLLAEWAGREDRRIAWVSLDRYDNDPARLLALLASAYARIDPRSPDLVAEVQGVGMSILGRAAPRLAAAFTTSTDPFVLMLDDLHEVQSSDCCDVLDLIVAKIPPGSQFVSTSRTEQSHLSRLRASGIAFEVRTEDLALDAAGARQIFSTQGISLSPDRAVEITERTEGWPAGLYLATLISRENSGLEGTLTGEDPYVSDYLYQEYLVRQPEELQRFLWRTAALEQLCGPLCDALLGSSGGAERLLYLERSNQFLIPLDRQRRWYRFHGLFREFLLGELRRREPESIEGLHLKAADWFESNGSPALALEHLLMTHAKGRAARLLTSLAMPTYYAGHISTVLRWISALGDADIERHPPLAVMVGWAGVLTGDPIEASRWLAFANSASFVGAPEDGSASFDSARAQLRAAMCVHGPERMMIDAQFAVSEEPPWGSYRDNALWLLGEAHLLAGDADAARRQFAEASETGASIGGTDGFVISESELALLAMDAGGWDEASDHLDAARVMIEEKRMQDYVMSVLTFAGAARLAYHRGRREEGQAELNRALRGREMASYALPFLAVRLRVQLARIFLGNDDPGTARHLVREIDDVLMHRPALGALVDEVDGLRGALASRTVRSTTISLLTPAELRLLPYLQTHLTMAAIAERLGVSRNTVNSQISSVYRKLGVSSRQGAVDQATAVGLLGG